jgi:hypothetical protein
MSFVRFDWISQVSLYESRLTETSHGSNGRLKLIQKEKSVENWFKNLIAHLTARRTGLVILKLSFDSEPQAAGLDGIPKIPEADDLDRRLAEAWTKSVHKPEPSRREQTVQDASARKAQAAIEEEWRKNGCYKDASGNWVVPDELMWRSLPRGEDR